MAFHSSFTLVKPSPPRRFRRTQLAALRDATNGGFALGSDRFQRQIAAMVGQRTWPGKPGLPKKEAPDGNQLNRPM